MNQTKAKSDYKIIATARPCSSINVEKVKIFDKTAFQFQNLYLNSFSRLFDLKNESQVTQAVTIFRRTTVSLQGLVIQGLAIQGLAIQGSAIEGLAIQGSAIQGSAIQGSAIQGLAIQGSAIQGLAIQGSAIQSLAI